MVFWTPTHGIIPTYPWYLDPTTHGILTTSPWYIDPHTHGFWPLSMVFSPSYPWYIDNLTHGISTLLSMVFWPPIHGIKIHLPMVFLPPTNGIWSPKPMGYWPTTRGILTPLPMVYRSPYTCYFDLPTHGISNPISMVFWTPAYLLIRNDGSQNTMGVQFTIQVGQNTVTPVLSSFMTYHRICNQINMTSTTSGAGTAYLSRAPKFSPGF